MKVRDEIVIRHSRNYLVSRNPEKLSQRVINLLIDTNNFWGVSMASVWELQIKSRLGKLNLSSSLPNLIETQQRVNNLQL